MLKCRQKMLSSWSVFVWCRFRFLLKKGVVRESFDENRFISP